MFTLVPDENSMEDPLCNSSFGSTVSLDYVTPDTKTLHISEIEMVPVIDRLQFHCDQHLDE